MRIGNSKSPPEMEVPNFLVEVASLQSLVSTLAKASNSESMLPKATPVPLMAEYRHASSPVVKFHGPQSYCFGWHLGEISNKTRWRFLNLEPWRRTRRPFACRLTPKSPQKHEPQELDQKPNLHWLIENSSRFCNPSTDRDGGCHLIEEKESTVFVQMCRIVPLILYVFWSTWVACVERIGFCCDWIPGPVPGNPLARTWNPGNAAFLQVEAQNNLAGSESRAASPV